MGEQEIWLNATDLSAVRLRCSHCETEAVFSATDPTGPPNEIRCSNCNMVMAGATTIVSAYREFIRAVKTDSRGVRFLAKVG
jgi:phage FluMu protein Com